MNSNNTVPVIGASNAVGPQNMMSGLSVATSENCQSIALANAKAAESIGQIMAAKAAPRNELLALQKIKNACERVALAEISQYELARGGTSISGATVHLLRAISIYWGNMKSGSVITNTTASRTTGYSYAWDMEMNCVVEKPFDVPHIRYTRNGSHPLTNPDDIRFLVNSYASRSERNALECVIPKDIVMAAVEFCNATLAADMKKFNLDKLLEAFAVYGVTKEDIEAFSQRNIEALEKSPGLVVRLRKILNSLKDGIATKEDVFKSNPSAYKGRDKPDDAVTNDAKPTAAKVKRGKTVEEFLADHPSVIEDEPAKDEKPQETDAEIDLSDEI